MATGEECQPLCPRARAENQPLGYSVLYVDFGSCGDLLGDRYALLIGTWQCLYIYIYECVCVCLCVCVCVCVCVYVCECVRVLVPHLIFYCLTV